MSAYGFTVSGVLPVLVQILPHSFHHTERCNAVGWKLVPYCYHGSFLAEHQAGPLLTGVNNPLPQRVDVSNLALFPQSCVLSLHDA